MLIRAHHLAWLRKEREDLINNAVNTYILSRRKLIVSYIDSGACSQPPANVAAISSSVGALDSKPDDFQSAYGDDDEPLQSDEDANCISDHHTGHSDSNDYEFGAGDIDMANKILFAHNAPTVAVIE